MLHMLIQTDLHKIMVIKILPNLVHKIQLKASIMVEEEHREVIMIIVVEAVVDVADLPSSDKFASSLVIGLIPGIIALIKAFILR